MPIAVCPITTTPPLALALPSAIHFLHFLLTDTSTNNTTGSSCNSGDSSTTLLIICSTRNDFIHSLLTTSSSSIPPDPLLSLLLPSPFSTLTTPIRIVFTPTYLHLRAYLSALPPTATLGTLAIWGLVEVHSGTTEFSAQGIARTTALVVATGVATAGKLIVGGLKSSSTAGCCSGSGSNSDAGGVSLAAMDVQVPILNSTIRLGKDMARVASEKVCVRGVFARWFLWRENCGNDSGNGAGGTGELGEEEGEVVVIY